MKFKARNRQISFDKTVIMGILNVTPNSFTDGGLFFDNPAKAVGYAQRMVLQGADIIDIGGESIKLGAERVTVEEELRRVIPVIKKIRKDMGKELVISIDTYKSKVALQAIKEGVDIVNDASGFQMDDKMAEIIAKTRAGVIITHMRNRLGIKNMPGDIVGSTKKFLSTQIQKLEILGVLKNQIIIDPGFGFAKTADLNLEIIRRLDEFEDLKAPVMIALSRKSVFGKVLQKEFDSIIGINERLSACLAATAVAVLKGASIVRTHDIYQTKNFLAMLDKLKS